MSGKHLGMTLSIQRSRRWRTCSQRLGDRPVQRSGVAVAVAVALVLLSALFLFVDRATMPIQLWDEARNIVNALEMDRDGFGLVTTYGGLPDLWNTKPPLLIWLMTACVRVFGPTEWALRLPSMVATLGTVLLLFWFVRRTLRSTRTAAFSAAFLVLSPAYFGEHSARTADYDAVLVFFVTAHLCLLFLAVHRPRPSWALLWSVGAAIWCAVMTKSVAAVVPEVGVLAYLLLTARWRRLLATPRYAVVALGVAAALALFLALREAESGGYLGAIWINDLGGRFNTSLVPVKARWFYFDALGAGYFSVTALLFLAPFALLFATRRQRFVLLFSLCIAGATLVVFTCAASKLTHYILSAVPFMAIASAICLRVIIGRARRASRSAVPFARLLTVALLLTGIVPVMMGVVGAVARRYVHPVVGEGARSGQYGILFERLAAGTKPIVVVDPGFVRDDDLHFTPVLLAYRTMWSLNGVASGHSTDLGSIDRYHRVILASCHPAGAARIAASGPNISHLKGCAATVVD